ncbi:MAG: hypothetical protein ACPLPR_02075 [Bacillota bacterium]
MGALGKRLGSFTLRNEYEVYVSAEAPDIYIVRQHSKSQVFEHHVLKGNVRLLQRGLGGRAVTVDNVLDKIQQGDIPGLRLYCYGYKKRFEVQNILVVLCVLGLATAEKQGRGFVYWIRPSCESISDLL